MRLPDLVAYQAAVQHPSTAFADPQLRAATVATGPLGLPRAVAGNFAVTYQLRSGVQQWAVRCFHREATDRASRYAAISQALAKLRGGPLVPIEYLDPGVLVGQTWYPITKMPWIDGYPLNRAVEASLSKPIALRDLERRFLDVVAALRQSGIAHGDLQHGNILVEPSGSLRLVDYDGMFVPALRGRAASECGDPNYQHPRRGRQFDADLDRFAALAIVVALRALAAAPRLWQAYNTGDNLLFRRSDFANPAQSALFGELSTIREVRDLARQLAVAAQGDCARVPLVDGLVGNKEPPQTSIKPAHVAVLNQLYGPRPARAAQRGRSWKLRRANAAQALAFSHDGSLLASGEGDGRITLREAANGRTHCSLRLPPSSGTLRALAFSSADRLLGVSADGPNLRVFDATERRRLHEVLCRGAPLRAVALSGDGAWLAAATTGGMLRCWRLSDARLIAAFELRGSASGLALSRDGRYLAAGVLRGVQIHDVANGRPLWSIAVGQRATCLAFSRDGAQLAVGTAGGLVTQWDTSTAQPLAELAWLEVPLQALVLSSDTRVLAAAGQDGSLWLRRVVARPTAGPSRRRPETATTGVISPSQRLFDWLRRVALL